MSNKVKILVVDDEPPVAMMIVFILTRADCDARSAWNAERALRLAQAEKFDLITTDVDMPGVNGFEFFRQLKAIPHLKETPVVFVSGNATIERQQQALELGAADFIGKPFEMADFIYRIKSQIKAANPSEQIKQSEGVTA